MHPGNIDNYDEVINDYCYHYFSDGDKNADNDDNVDDDDDGGAHDDDDDDDNVNPSIVLMLVTVALSGRKKVDDSY